jgi:predicted DNA-binding transcriptional regulator YafY
MRADRLLSMLMLLQTRGRLTARALAAELEVSERTVYRDLDALSAAGVPVYAERGPGGGCALLDSYRTTLTGLTDDEVRALFMLTIPAALTQLGVGPELKAALLKLSAALPAERRRDEAWVRQRIHLDWSGWEQADEPAPHLRTVQRAVWEDRRLWLAYQRQAGPAIRRFERTVDPYGLVAKAGVWHLVCAADGKLRVYRVSRLLEVRLTEERFQRPAGFDLAAFWEAWSARPEVRLPPFLVTVRLLPALAAELPGAVAIAPPDAQGWITITAPFAGFEPARTRLLGLGGAVEVLEPLSLRHSVADFAAQVVAAYR